MVVRREVVSSARAFSNSSRITSMRRICEPRISSSSRMVPATSVISAVIFSRSRPVRRCSRKSRMPRAWASVRRTVFSGVMTLPGSSMRASRAETSAAGQSRDMSSVRAAAGSGLARMTRMTSSILATAMARPTRRWARSRALASSKRERRRMTSSRKAMNAISASLRPKSRGRPPSSASMFTPKLTCMLVWRKSWLSTTSAVASRLSSITTRMPERSDSSRISPIPSIVLARTSSPMRSSRAALFTW